MQPVVTNTFKLGQYSLEDILADVACSFSVTAEYISSKHRKQDKVFMRKVFCWVVKELTAKRYSLLDIAYAIGYSNHTTVIHQLVDVKDFFLCRDSQWLEYWEHFTEHSRIWKEFKSK